MKILINILLLLSVSTTTFTAKVIGVKDGDTIEVLYQGKGQTVRLLDIDCPEKKQAFGQKAKQFTSDFCFEKTVRIEAKGKDRYGRILGTVYVDNKCLNEALVSGGFAWQFKKYSHNGRYEELENKARANKVGLWSEPNAVAPWDFRKSRTRTTTH